MTANVQIRQVSALHRHLNSRSNRRRVSNCGNIHQNRTARAPTSDVQRTSALPELSGKQQQVEAAALHVLDQHCEQNSSQAASDVAMQLLRAVVITQKVKPELALGAARQLELHADVNQDTSTSLDGRWRLVFAATSSSKLFWYIPVQEFKDINMVDHTVKLVSYLGPVTTSFEGKFEMTNQDMAFSFQTLIVSIFGRTVVNRPIDFAEKTYRYFYVDQSMACARSVGTGLVVLKKGSSVQ